MLAWLLPFAAGLYLRAPAKIILYYYIIFLLVCKAFASTVEQDGAGVERAQKQKAEQGEVQQIARPQRGIRPRKLLVGNQTCHRSDQRSQPAQIAADNQRAPVGRKAGQQQRAGTLLMTWLVRTAAGSSFPASVERSQSRNGSMRSILPMKTKKARKVQSRE